MEKSIICITGGIASGKTMVADYLEKFGFDLIDADLAARHVVAKGTDCLKKLASVFGREVLNKDESLNRSFLKQIVFNSADKLAVLNQITHPYIELEIKKQLFKVKRNRVLLVIPLLSFDMIEKYGISRVLVVDVDNNMQLERILKRDAVDIEMAKKIIDSQISRTGRLEIADDILVNNGSVTELYDCCGKYNEMIQQ